MKASIRIRRLTMLLASTLAFAGCATVSMMPSTASEVQFGTEPEGKTGWSSYREEARFPAVPTPLVFEAAKAGLGDAGFALRKTNAAAGVVFGEHGMTMHDWNVIAGVYFKPDGADTVVVVLVEGSKDIGYSGDVTGGPWTGRILKGMREYLAASRSDQAAATR